MKLSLLSRVFPVFLSLSRKGLWVGVFMIFSLAGFSQTLSIDDVTQAEGNGGGTTIFTFTVTINEGPQASPITFEYSTSDGTAAEPGDYAQVSNQLVTILAGSTEATIDISVVADNILEPAETFEVTLANPSPGVSFSDDTGVGTILNDDTAALTIGNETVSEADGDLIFTVTLNNAVQNGTEVTYTFTNGTATGGGVDFTGTPGTLTFAGAAGEAETIIVPINNDLIVEGPESFTVNLGPPTNGVSVLGSPATGTINDNDSAAITIADVTVTEGTGMLFTVTLNNAVSGGFTVTTGYTGGTATGGGIPLVTPEDYNNAAQVLNFAGTAGETQQFTVATLDDAIVEGQETFTVTLTSDDPAVDDSDTALATINDNDSAAITIADVTVTEGTGMLFTVTLNNAVSGGFTVTTGYTGGTATGGTTPLVSPEDYNNAPQVLTFTGTAGETRQFTVITLDDAIVEGPENFTVTLASSSAAVDDSDTATGTINDNDLQAITITDVSQNEGNSGQTAFTFTVSVAGGGNALSNITFDFNTSNGSATVANNDYVATSGSGQINAGSSSTTVTVQVNGDTNPENDETFNVLLSNPVNATISDNTGVGTIQNDDSQTISINNLSQVEGSGGGTTNFVFTVSINGGGLAVQDIDFRVNTDNGSATQPADYTRLNNVQFTIPAGQNSVQVPVAVVADAIPEPNETFTVEIDNPSSGADLGTAVGTGTILNDDLQGLVINNVSQNEGNSGTSTFQFTVSLQGGGNAVQPISFTYSTQNGTATLADNDYTQATNVAASIPAGQSSTTLSIVVVGDTRAEANETFAVVLGNVSGGTIAQGTGTGTIQNDDPFRISIADLDQNEGDSGTTPFTFTVSLGDGAEAVNAINFNWATVAGTATAGEDFVAASGSGTIDPGETSTTLTVSVNGDEVFEENETFSVVLSNVTSGVVVTKGTAIATIRNDDGCDSGDQAPAANPDQPTNFCTEDTIPSLLDFVISTPPTGAQLTFTRNPDLLDNTGYLTAEEIAAPDVGEYYAFYLDTTHNCASPALTITIVRNQTPQLDGFTGDAICGPGQVTLTASGSIPNVPTAPDINWYTAATGGTPVFTGTTYTTTLSTTTSYWVEAFANGCSSPRQEVVAIVSPIVTTGTPSDGSACSVAANGPTLRDLDDRLLGESAGVWAIETIPEGSTVTIAPGNLVNFEGQPEGTYSFRFTTTGAEAPCVDETVVINITVNDCDTDSDGDGLLDGLEATLGTNPNNPDTDGDGIEDGVEVGPDTANPLNEDGDEFIDALDSNILDTDLDTVNDQQDPANDNPCIPNATSDLCAVDLEVVKTVSSPQASVGQQITFTVALNNLSDLEVLDIEVGDLLQSGFAYVSHTASAGTYDPDTGAWLVPTLPGQESATLEITVSVLADGEYTNTAELLDSLPLDGNPANDTSTVTVEIVLPTGADLSITKFAQITPGGNLSDVSIAPLVGDRIRFVITVTNISAEATVTGIQVEDLISPEADTGFEYASHFYTPATLPAGAYNPETGIWNIPSLGPGESYELSIAAFVRRQGSFTNTARILAPADADPSNNTASVLVDVNARTPADPGFIFNQFSPNGDGINDFLKIRLGRFNEETGLEEVVINSYSIQIFNRYGQSVFEGSNLSNEVIWDGFHNGAEAPSGTYFYVLEYTETGGAQATAKGWIQLIR